MADYPSQKYSIGDGLGMDSVAPIESPADADVVDSLAFGVGGGAGSAAAQASVGGYIDSAIIRTRVQFRYDNVQGGNSDRAEYLYGAYNTQVAPVIGLGGNGTVLGPSRVIIDNLDYNEVSSFLELALSDRLSGFVELPVRWNDIDGIALPGGDLDDSGLADMNAGVRYGIIQDCDRYLTVQLKVFAPTGDAASALGTGHTSLQPGLLFQHDRGRWFTFGEVHDWIGLDGSTFTANTAGDPLDGRRYDGNVLRYGLGAAYALGENPCCDRRLLAVGEVVGWTVLDGLQTLVDTTDPNNVLFNVVDANGDSIVNAKVGVRYTSGNHSLYAGYGFPLTNTEWYSDILRVEYQYNVW